MNIICYIFYVCSIRFLSILMGFLAPAQHHTHSLPLDWHSNEFNNIIVLPCTIQFRKLRGIRMIGTHIFLWEAYLIWNICGGVVMVMVVVELNTFILYFLRITTITPVYSGINFIFNIDIKITPFWGESLCHKRL